MNARLWCGALLAVGLAASASLPAQAPTSGSVITPGSAHGAPDGEQRSVSGRVMRGAATRVQPLGGAWVVLHRVGTDRAAPLDSVRTDAQGRYAFRYRTSGDRNAVYFASSAYGGIAYFSSPFTTRTASGDDADLVVHDTTSGPIPIAIRGRHVVIASPDAEGRRAVIEVFELSNDSSVTRLAAGDTGVVWQAPLLDGARDAKVGETDFSNGAVRFESGRVRLSAPFAPGLKRFSYRYTIPATESLAFVVGEPVAVLELLLEDALGRAEGGGLAPTGPATVSGRAFSRFLAQDVPAGADIRVSLPGPSGTSGMPLRVLAIMAALGAVLLVGLARTMMRRQAQAARPRATEDAAALRERLAALDTAFANLAQPTAEQRADHWQARAHLSQQITDAVAREQGLS